MNAANEAGYKIPEDIQIVCVLDTKYNKMFRPQLSSFVMPSYDLGAVAMRMMTKQLSARDNDEDEVKDGMDKNIELSYLYTPRGSTK